MLEVEEVMWRQRPRVSWLKHGDKNTSFFHTIASSRFQRNTIQGVWDEAKCWQGEEEGIGRTFEDYYVKLFTNSHLEVSEELIQSIHRKVSDPMNMLLSRDFQVSEVVTALRQMYPTFAPGLDGMPPMFKTVLDFLNLGITPPPPKKSSMRPTLS